MTVSWKLVNVWYFTFPHFLFSVGPGFSISILSSIPHPTHNVLYLKASHFGLIAAILAKIRYICAASYQYFKAVHLNF